MIAGIKAIITARMVYWIKAIVFGFLIPMPD